MKRITKIEGGGTAKAGLRVAAYARVSTDEEDQQSSIRVQREHYESYIKNTPGWEFAGVYYDEGITGTKKEKRPGLMQMMEDCRNGRIDYVITKSVSRFARNTLDCINYIRKLKEKGVAIYFEKENINTLDAKGELLITIMASLAQQESQSLSQNVKIGLQFRYQAGKVQVNCKRFLGYDKDKDGKLIINEEQAEVVRRIYREYLEGGSLGEICGSLMADGILNGAGNRKWIPSTIQKILTNEKYIGDALLQKTVTTDFLEKKREVNNGIVPQYYVEDSHEAIIPRDVYMRVQEEMVRRSALRSGAQGQKKRAYSSKYALSGICTCGMCGDVFRRVSWNCRGKRMTVWRCRTRVEGGPKACSAPTIKEEELQAGVVRAINSQIGRKSKVIKELAKMIKNMPADGQDAELKKIEKELAALQKELVGRASSDEEYGDLTEKILGLREKKQELLSRKAQALNSILMKERAVQFLEGQTAELEEFDEKLVRRLVAQVTIHPDLSMTVEFKSGSKVEA